MTAVVKPLPDAAAHTDFTSAYGTLTIEWVAGNPTVALSATAPDGDDGWSAYVPAADLLTALQKAERATSVNPQCANALPDPQGCQDVWAVLTVPSPGADTLYGVWVGERTPGDPANADKGSLVLVNGEDLNAAIALLTQVQAAATAFGHLKHALPLLAPPLR